MLYPGLLSITFRKHSPEEILRWAVEAELDGIEWGGDVHVPHGNLVVARELGRSTRNAGIEVAAYGSYYRLGKSESDGLSFRSVLDTALELEAPVIRVWAGTQGSAEATPEDRSRVIEDAHRICALAAKHPVQIALEYHGGTLTDTPDSTDELLSQLPEKNLRTYWQPPNFQTLEYCLDSLSRITSRLSHIHVFHWSGPPTTRHPLAEGESRWNAYFRKLHTLKEDRFAMLEFVKEDSPEQMLHDAKYLHRWCSASDSNLVSSSKID